MKKILIAYFTRRGENYVNGSVHTLVKGNNEVVAEKISRMLGANVDTFEIETVEPYPTDYYECIDQAKAEIRSQARPLLKSEVEDMAQYDTIVLGYPNWWGQLPMSVFTFLESYDFAGKTILPYCTHEGSGLSVTVRSIGRTLPKATIGEPLSIQGANVGQADGEISRWLKSNHLI